MTERIIARIIEGEKEIKIEELTLRNDRKQININYLNNFTGDSANIRRDIPAIDYKMKALLETIEGLKRELIIRDQELKEAKENGKI